MQSLGLVCTQCAVKKTVECMQRFAAGSLESLRLRLNIASEADASHLAVHVGVAGDAGGEKSGPSAR